MISLYTASHPPTYRAAVARFARQLRRSPALARSMGRAHITLTTPVTAEYWQDINRPGGSKKK